MQVTSFNVSVWNGRSFEHSEQFTLERGDVNSARKVYFSAKLRTQKVRIYPVTWIGGISMRFELIGCAEAYPTRPVVTTTAAPETTTAFDCTEWGSWVQPMDSDQISRTGYIIPEKELIARSEAVCSSPQFIQCRTQHDQTPHDEAGQRVTCNLWTGLRCLHSDQGNNGRCRAYEARVGCVKNIPECVQSTISPSSAAPLEVCPGVNDTAACPSSCPPGTMCDGLKCTKECPCIIDGHIVKPGEYHERSNCDQCLCEGNLIFSCMPKVCPTCPPTSNLIKPSAPNCDCQCHDCPPDKWKCINPPICLNMTQRCDGVKDCDTDEVNCPTTAAPPTCPPCPPLPSPPTLNEPGLVNILEPTADNCCTQWKTVCNATTCPPKPKDLVCETPSQLKMTKEKPDSCCYKHECFCPTNITCETEAKCPPGQHPIVERKVCGCVKKFRCEVDECRIMANKTLDGSGREVIFEQPRLITLKANEVHNEGYCKKCVCVQGQGDGKTTVRCETRNCPEKPREFDYVERENNTECCLPWVLTQCKIKVLGLDRYLQAGENVQIDKCTVVRCERVPGALGLVDRVRTRQVALCCHVNGTDYRPGEGIPSQRVCYEKKCAADVEGSDGEQQPIVTETRIVCPPVTRTCASGESSIDPTNKCCARCTTDLCTKCLPKIMRPPESTLRFFRLVESGARRECANQDVVPEVKFCDGFCNSPAQLLNLGVAESCNFCQASRTMKRNIKLTCANGDVISRAFLVPVSCSCGKCIEKKRP